MWAILFGIPFLTFMVVLQTTIISRLPLLHGTADLILLIILAWALVDRSDNAWIWSIVAGLMVGFVSALPFFVPIVVYLIMTGLTRLLQKFVWQTPILAMFLASFVGTFLIQGLTLLSLTFMGDTLPIRESLSLVTLPSALLNILLAVPVYALVREIAGWLSPIEMEK